MVSREIKKRVELLYNVKKREDFINSITNLIQEAAKLQIKLEEIREKFIGGVKL